MRSREVIPPEANRPGPRLRPKRHGAALIRRASVCSPDNPDLVVAKVNRFGFVGRSFKQRVHILVSRLKCSGNHKALLSAKLNQMRPDGEPHNSGGFAFAADFVNARDELAKRQGFLPAIRFHAPKCKSGNRAGAMGCSPHIRPGESKCFPCGVRFRSARLIQHFS